MTADTSYLDLIPSQLGLDLSWNIQMIRCTEHKSVKQWFCDHDGQWVETVHFNLDTNQGWVSGPRFLRADKASAYFGSSESDNVGSHQDYAGIRTLMSSDLMLVAHDDYSNTVLIYRVDPKGH